MLTEFGSAFISTTSVTVGENTERIKCTVFGDLKFVATWKRWFHQLSRLVQIYLLGTNIMHIVFAAQKPQNCVTRWKGRSLSEGNWSYDRKWSKSQNCGNCVCKSVRSWCRRLRLFNYKHSTSWRTTWEQNDCCNKYVKNLTLSLFVSKQAGLSTRELKN